MGGLIVAVALGLAGVPDALAGEHTVIAKERALLPRTVEAKVGDTLVFRNEDEVVHILYSRTPGHEFHLGEQPPGQVRKVALSAPGEITVGCHIHTIIRMTVIVSE
jgi:plastocyanin